MVYSTPLKSPLSSARSGKPIFPHFKVSFSILLSANLLMISEVKARQSEAHITTISAGQDLRGRVYLIRISGANWRSMMDQVA
jgi:hypothetical protein